MGLEFMDSPRRATSNTSEKLTGAACDGCLNMEVITSGRRVRKERDWCSGQRSFVEPMPTCQMRKVHIE